MLSAQPSMFFLHWNGIVGVVESGEGFDHGVRLSCINDGFVSDEPVFFLKQRSESSESETKC